MWPTRRVILAVPALAVPVAAAAGCSSTSKAAPGPTREQITAAEQARARAAAAETDLLKQYDAALALPSVSGDQTLAARLSAVRAEHASHLAALREGGLGGAEATPSPSPSSGSSLTSTPGSSPNPTGTSTTLPTSTTTTPMDAKTAVGGLVKSEQDAATRLTADVLALDGRTAQLLASIAASESGHAALLLGATS